MSLAIVASAGFGTRMTGNGLRGRQHNEKFRLYVFHWNLPPFLGRSESGCFNFIASGRRLLVDFICTVRTLLIRAVQAYRVILTRIVVAKNQLVRRAHRLNASAFISHGCHLLSFGIRGWCNSPTKAYHCTSRTGLINGLANSSTPWDPPCCSTPTTKAYGWEPLGVRVPHLLCAGHRY